MATCNLADRVGNAVQRGDRRDGGGRRAGGGRLSIPASLAVLSGHDPRHGDEPYIDQLVLAYTGGPGGPSADGWLTFAGLTDAGVLRGTPSSSTSCASRSGSTAAIAIDTEGWAGGAARRPPS